MSKLVSVIKPRKPWLGPIKVAFALVAALPILIVLVLIGYWLLSPPILTALNNRTIAAMRSELPKGMLRADCYTWLRRHRLTATNGAYGHWHSIGTRAWQRVDDGAWPQPETRLPKASESPRLEAPENPLHPEVYITLDAGWTGGCGGLITEKIPLTETTASTMSCLIINHTGPVYKRVAMLHNRYAMTNTNTFELSLSE